MNIEKNIFKNTKVNIKKLISYGFVYNDNIYEYRKEFMDSFKAYIFVDKKGIVSGKIYDLSTQEEYINYRIESQSGQFINKVRKEYEDILKDICDNCFDRTYFMSNQANRITELIYNEYHDEPEFPFERFPEYGIFKNRENGKWYAIILNIEKSKLDKKSSLEVEIINVKLDSSKIAELLNRKGFYEGYHMNKKNWISIILDDSLNDQEIFDYIKESHSYTIKSKEWIIPANPKFYDVINCFNETDTIKWKQSNNIKLGDIVYIYVGAPYSSILYKCEVIGINIPYKYKDKNLSIDKVMDIKLIEKYDKDKYTFTKLNKYGIKSIRGPRSITEDLRREMNK